MNPEHKRVAGTPSCMLSLTAGGKGEEFATFKILEGENKDQGDSINLPFPLHEPTPADVLTAALPELACRLHVCEEKGVGNIGGVGQKLFSSSPTPTPQPQRILSLQPLHLFTGSGGVAKLPTMSGK